MTVVPVKPDLIVWAREHRGLSLEEAADKLRVSPDHLREIEDGLRLVNLTFFKRISQKFKIPGPTLMRRSRPNVPPMPMDFRTVSGVNPQLGFDTRMAISYAYTIEQNILELVEANATQQTPLLPHLSLRQNAEEAAEAERQRLGVNAIAQLTWRSNEAFRNWRTIIEAAGTYVILKKFPLGECRGFTICRDPNAAIIVINKADLYEPARTFTLIHEYAHILLRQPGISDLNDRHPVEAFCNRFASAFLMPRELIRQILPYWPDQPEVWPLNDLRQWANRLKVSQQSLALRLEALGVAPNGYYGTIIAMQQSVVRREGAGGDYVNTQVNELGDKFTNTVLTAARHAIIPPVEASDMLDIAPRHFRRVAEQIHRQNQRAGFE